MIRLSIKPGEELSAGTLEQSQEIQFESYILENTDSAGSFRNYLNAVGIIPSAGGVFVSKDTPIYSAGFTEIGDSGIDKTIVGDNFAITCNSQNTFYIPAKSSFYGENLEIRFLPKVKMQFQQTIASSAAYDVFVNIEVYAIGEGNVALSKSSFDAKVVYDGWATGVTPSPEIIEIDPANKRFNFSANCVSHGTSSTSIFSSMEKALSIPQSALPDDKKTMR
jgi:hypothetical protein